MALQVWLPLNGDLNNYGVSGLKVVQTTTPVYINGKIGKAMSTGAFYLPAADVAKFYNGNTMSWAFWIYPTTSGSLSYPIIGNASTSSGNRMYTLFQYPNGVDLHLSWRSETSETTTFLNAVYSNAFTVNTWNHCVVTYDNPTCKVYINGELKQTYSGANTRTNFNYDVPVGSTNGRYLNDIRIYDHCLSPKEVKEISKALVVHFPLNRNGLGIPNLADNSNTFAGWSAGSGWTIGSTDDGLKTYSFSRTGATGNNWIRLIPTVKVNGNNYASGITVSMELLTPDKSAINQKCLGALQNYQSDGSRIGWVEPAWNLDNVVNNQWSLISYTFSQTELIRKNGVPEATYSYTQFSFQLVQNGNITIRKIMIAEGNKVQLYTLSVNDTASTKVHDTSGFGNHGTVVGNVSVTSDTPRYKIATGPFGSGKGIYCTPNPAPRVDGETITVSCWFKQLGRSGYQDIVCDRSGSGNFTWLLYSHTTDGSIQLHGADQYKSSVIPSLNEWHHVAAVVYTNQTYSLYLDGVKVVNAVTYKYRTTGASNYLCVGKYGATTTCSEPFNGYISDVRIYATALSDADILELYQKPVSITQHSMMTQGEFVEG